MARFYGAEVPTKEHGICLTSDPILIILHIRDAIQNVLPDLLNSGVYIFLNLMSLISSEV